MILFAEHASYVKVLHANSHESYVGAA